MSFFMIIGQDIFFSNCSLRSHPFNSGISDSINIPLDTMAGTPIPTI